MLITESANVKVVTRKIYTCDSCGGECRRGDKVYVRYGPSPAVYCMVCYKQRNSLWRERREGKKTNKQLILETLQEQPFVTVKQLQELTNSSGAAYLDCIRDLVMDGAKIKTEYRFNENGYRVKVFTLKRN